jgi:hypothetical protein
MEEENIEEEDNYGYTVQIETLLKEKANKLASYRWLCNEELHKQRYRNKLLCIFSNTLSGLVGSGSALNLLSDYSIMSYNTIILNSLMIISTMINVLYNSLDIKNKISILELKNSKYSELFNTINNNFILRKEERCNAQIFVNNISLEILHSNNLNSYLSDSTLFKYKKKIEHENSLEQHYNPENIIHLTPI